MTRISMGNAFGERRLGEYLPWDVIVAIIRIREKGRERGKSRESVCVMSATDIMWYMWTCGSIREK